MEYDDTVRFGTMERKRGPGRKVSFGESGMSIKEFFGFGGYSRPAEGYMSWQHLTFVTSLIVIMFACAVLLGRKYKDRKDKGKVLIWAALLIDGFELFKIVMLSIRGADPWHFLYDLPLFLCSIQLITIPLAAFSKGRVKESALDFVMIFGLLGAVMGTYFAGNNYGTYPVLSIDNVVSGITHCISGFSSLYIMFAGLASMKKRNIPITLGILAGFCVAAYTANVLLDYNYMFLMAGHGTPYDILFDLVDGSPVWYPLGVVGLFVIYIVSYYQIYYTVGMRSEAKKEAFARA